MTVVLPTYQRGELLERSIGSVRAQTRLPAELIREHRTPLVFVQTRKMAERVSAQLSKLPRQLACAG